MLLETGECNSRHPNLAPYGSTGYIFLFPEVWGIALPGTDGSHGIS